MKMRYRVLAVLLLTGFTLWAQAPSAEAPPEVDEALLGRVNAFYTYFQQRQYRQAEALVAEEDRDAYYGIAKAPILGFEVGERRFDSGFETAQVTVVCQMITPVAGNTGPIPMPLTSRWRQVEGEWYLYFPKRPGADSQGQAQTAFGPMNFQRGGPLISAPGQVKAFDERSLGGMFKVDARSVTFAAQSKDAVTEAITLTNSGPARLTLRKETKEVKGIEISGDDDPIEPGEARKISFTYDPQVVRYNGHTRVRFTILPINQQLTIRIQFE